MCSIIIHNKKYKNNKSHDGHTSFGRHDPFHVLLYRPFLLMTLKQEVHNGFKYNVIFLKQ